MDINHYYLEKGSGEALILLHGNGGDSGYFNNQIDEYSKYYHVFALDTRGHGKTEKGDLPFSIKQFSEDLKLFMDEKNIEKANILGFSDGGNIALYFALKYPDSVKKLILNGANLFPRGVKNRYQYPIELSYKVNEFFSCCFLKAKKKAEMLGLMVHEPDIKPEELKALTCPVLVIAGKNDMIKDSHTRLIAKSIPRSELRIINGDHFIANKRSEEFNKEVLEFLKG